MSIESRLRRLETRRQAVAASPCSCNGPLVLWPGEEQEDITCPECGRPRTVVRVQYEDGEPEEQREALESLTPEEKREAEEHMLAGETVILEVQSEDWPPPCKGLRKYRGRLFKE